MRILVLDTIHGGDEIARAFCARGDTVDTVDVYRDGGTVDAATARSRNYDLIAAPVHLDPDHPLLRDATAPVITHHEAVRQLLGTDLPRPMIEITGARGKTTTAHAIAHVLPGNGILHTSSGMYRFPEKELIGKASITPASVLKAATLARECGGWLVAEESLGVTGAGSLAIITSNEDYPFAAGKKQALAAKAASVRSAGGSVLVATGIPDCGENVSRVGDLVSCNGSGCRVSFSGSVQIFSNPLLLLESYRAPLMLAAAAAVILGLDPSHLASFAALPGRMSTRHENGILIVDNANSGTNAFTTEDAVRYARAVSGSPGITLVIGQAEGDGKVCEGFSPDQIRATVRRTRPDRIVLVGPLPAGFAEEIGKICPAAPARAANLEEGYSLATNNTHTGSIVLAVKTWR